MATKDTTTDGGLGTAWGTYLSSGVSIPSSITMYPTDKAVFRKSTNMIEGKEWFELDVSQADTIVIIHEGKKVEMDKKDFLQCIGLEW